MKCRLDDLLVQRGLAASKAQAKALIMSGRVRHGTTRLEKPGKEFDASIELIVEQPPRFVSRGGEKLQGAIDAFQLEFRGRHVLDVGASTGGFTDCALQAGAESVVCVDVGRAQLHSRLRDDPRVTNLEQVNARTLSAEALPRSTFGAIVMDVSFISLRAVLPAVWPLLEPDGFLVALIKPQFEAGKAEVDKGRGIIRDPEVHQRVVAEIREFVRSELPGSIPVGLIDSPLVGTDGNREFLMVVRRTPAQEGPERV
jgi:23S rRNA (cytidine1920-2'-O)/16S rRNA (cytidine1409-2'-O)-methyltransferase